MRSADDDSKRIPATEACKVRVYLINAQRRIERLIPQPRSITNARKLSNLRSLESGLVRELEYWTKLDTGARDGI